MTEKHHDFTRDMPEMTGEGLDLDSAWSVGEDVLFDDDPAEAAMAEPEVTLPPERIRFTAPMVMRRDGENIDGALLNLSVHGVAAIAPIEARPGDRVWIEFRLHLAEDPVSLLCEVIWCAPQEDGDFAYGLRFANMTLDEERRVHAVVAERSEGRAGEWPLPVVPDAPPATPRTTSPWLSAAAGMAAGIALALLLSVIPTIGVTHAEPAIVPAAKPDVALASDPQRVQPAAATPALAPPQEPEPETKPETKPEPASIPEREPVVAAPAATPASEPPPAVELEPGFPSRRNTAEAMASDGLLRPLGSASSMEIELLTDGSVADHVSFWLEEPKRLVVDIYGRKSGFSRRSFGIDHPLASQLRIGQHAGKVRFVIETADEVSTQVRTRAAGDALVVELRRR
jgi:hypothetical protein